MTKVLQALRSRTFWTVVAIVAVNTLPQVRQYLPQGVSDFMNVALGFAATYFHVNPSQSYTGQAPLPPQ